MKHGINLRSCPFCGGTASAVKRKTKNGIIAYVECNVCKAKTGAERCFEAVESDDWEDSSIFSVTSRWNNRNSRRANNE